MGNRLVKIRRQPDLAVMIPHFQITTAKPWHCGGMVPRLRREHLEAVARTGMDAHRELRSMYDQSSYRRALLMNGQLAGLGGVTGGLASATGFAWVVLTEAATRYPLVLLRRIMRELDGVMATKRELATTVIGGDEAALRMAIFLGFHVADVGPGAPAQSRFARRQLRRHIESNPDLRLPVGNGYCVAMGYHASHQLEDAA
jgi:hypothetical protein